MMNFAEKGVMALQETTLLVSHSAGTLFKRPFYAREIVQQADAIGFGSLMIIVLTGFFTGAVLCVQTYPSLQNLGVQSQTGHLVALSLLRELAPVLTALMIAGRAGSAIAAERLRADRRDARLRMRSGMQTRRAAGSGARHHVAVTNSRRRCGRHLRRWRRRHKPFWNDARQLSLIGAQRVGA